MSIQCQFCRPSYRAVRVDSPTALRAHMIADHSVVDVVVMSALFAVRHPVLASRTLWRGRTERRQWRKDDRR